MYNDAKTHNKVTKKLYARIISKESGILRAMQERSAIETSFVIPAAHRISQSLRLSFRKPTQPNRF